MKNNQDKILLEELKSIFQEHPDVIDFLYAYNELLHRVDDIIDENGSYRDVLKVTSMSAGIYTSPFWQKYGSQLLVVDQLINNQYADSVEWECSDNEWMQRDSKCLCHSGYNMTFAVILLLRGYDTLRKVSSRWRERAHEMHLDGKPDVKFEVALQFQENFR